MKLKTKVYKPFTKDEISIRRDVIFRMVFGDNYRSEYLKELLESLLHKKITNIVIRNDVAIDKVHGDDKTMRLDISYHLLSGISYIPNSSSCSHF